MSTAIGCLPNKHPMRLLKATVTKNDLTIAFCINVAIMSSIYPN